MDQVTLVESPCGTKVKAAVSCPTIGLVKSSDIWMLAGVDSKISMRPAPALLLPSQLYTAP